jgi:hypothetical protein
MLVKEVIRLENACCSLFHPRQSADETREKGFQLSVPTGSGSPLHNCSGASIFSIQFEAECGGKADPSRRGGLGMTRKGAGRASPAPTQGGRRGEETCRFTMK